MRTRKPNFEITNCRDEYARLLRVIAHSNPAYSVRESWRFIEQMGENTIYVRSKFNPETIKEDSTELEIRNSEGISKAKLVLDHGIYRFKAASASDRFVASSDDLLLYLYSVSDGCLATYNLKRHASDKYHVRRVDISSDGQYALFTHVDEAYLLDSRLRVLQTWKVPCKDGWVREADSSRDRLPQEYARSLAVLGLSGRPTLETVKGKFRSLVLKHHPDLNPGDPNATERMKQINLAYGVLTGEDAKHAFDGLENADYYYKLIESFEVSVPGTSLTVSIRFGFGGPAEDWIYATHLGREARKVLLGCYSGKVYSASRSGELTNAYKNDDVVDYLREFDGFLHVGTERLLRTVSSGGLVASIDRQARDRLVWHDQGLVILGTRQIRLFSLEGVLLAQVSFRESLRAGYLAGGLLRVMTRNETFEFAVGGVGSRPAG